MTGEYRWAESYSACRLELDFPSLVKLTTIVGACVGAMLIPFMLLFGVDYAKAAEAGVLWILVPTIVVVTPAAGALNGVLTGVLGYPVYRAFSQKTKGQAYTGIFVGLKSDGV